MLRRPKVKRFVSYDHFTMDGTLIEAWVSMKSLRVEAVSAESPSPGHNGERDFKGEARSNDTHAAVPLASLASPLQPVHGSSRRAHAP